MFKLSPWKSKSKSHFLSENSLDPQFKEDILASSLTLNFLCTSLLESFHIIGELNVDKYVGFYDQAGTSWNWEAYIIIIYLSIQL